MMIDASAIVGILNGESEAPALAAAIGAAKARYTSPIAVYEATVALMRENKWSADEAGEIVRQFSRRRRSRPSPSLKIWRRWRSRPSSASAKAAIPRN
jgi:uncharacterized protein with PIN domain